MDFRSFFPLNTMVKQKDVTTLVVAIVIYIGVSGLIGIVSGLLWWIPAIGWLLRIISFLVGLYSLAGITFAALQFAGK